MDTYNLVIILPDQLRKDYLGCYGNTKIGTQHIDVLARSGVRFDNMYCAAPLCGPSRCSFATSTYMGEHGHRNYWSTISPDVPNLVTSLKAAGYRTGMFGKNHLFTYSRLHEVWDELDEICLGNYDGHPDYIHSYSSFTLAKDHPFNITHRLTSEGIDFIRNSQNRPFLLWLNYQDPHPAFCCPEPYDRLFDPRDIELSPAVTGYDTDRQPIRNEVFRIHSEMPYCSELELKQAMCHYMGQVRYIDDSVGRITQALRETGNEKKTVILFFSDHGEFLGDYRMFHKNPTFYECLSHIPAILVHPDGRWKGMEFSGLTEEIDIVPTLLEILGVPIPPTMMGRSWKKDLDDNRITGRETILCEAGGGAPTCKVPIPGMVINAPFAPTSFGPGAMIRWKQYKLSIYGDDMHELYDLSSDPHELNNVYGKDTYAQVQNQMTVMLCERLLSVKTRDTGSLAWDYPPYPYDVRFEPLENSGAVLEDVRASGEYRMM